MQDLITKLKTTLLIQRYNKSEKLEILHLETFTLINLIENSIEMKIPYAQVKLLGIKVMLSLL